MPLFDFLCMDCGELNEILVSGVDELLKCKKCDSSNLKKMLSAPSSFSGNQNHSVPGTGDTPCCGSSPSHAGCSGPGSCCGKLNS